MKIPPESELFKLLSKSFGTQNNDSVKVGVAELDDAAVFSLNKNQDLVIASDFVRGSEFYLFQLGFLNYFDVGYYLIAANISDMAAMGCAPSGLLTVVRYSKGMTQEDFESVIAGIAQAAADYECPVLGGDTGGYINDVFSATAFSVVESGKYLLRSAVREGDILCVSGALGGGIGALTYFKELRGKAVQLAEEEESKLLRYWKRPKARVDFGKQLVKSCPNAACMDISDGLKSSIEQLSSISKMNFRLRPDQVPIVPEVKKITALVGLDELAFASSASVDFELLFTVPNDDFARVKKEFAEAGMEVFNIGEASKNYNNDLLMNDGSVAAFAGVAWQHQQGDHVKDIINKTKAASGQNI